MRVIIRLVDPLSWLFAPKRRNAMTDEDFDAFLALANDELVAKQNLLQAEFSLGNYDRFAADYAAGTITFFNQETPQVEVEILPVATHIAEKNSLKWFWANQQLPQSVRDSASRVKTLYDLTGFDMFANEAVECDETMAWEITAMACKSLSALGAYRVPHGNVSSYVLITGIRRVG